MSNCLFCNIIAGRIPAKMVYEDEDLVAFEDINPQAPVHLLLVPRKHIPTTLDAAPEDQLLLGRIMLAAAQLARQFGFAEDGFRIVNNCNDAGGQTVWHIHFHLLGGRVFSWPPG